MRAQSGGARAVAAAFCSREHMSGIRLIVGLGNPGKAYEATRHNAGFWLVERFAARERITLRNDAKYHAYVGRHEPSGAWLLLPQTHMNASGRSVGLLAGFFKIPASEILVAHDELDFPPGAAKIKQGGGIAGHNGLKDIAARLGSLDFWRLRLGIGHPGDKGQVADYVLKKASPEDREAIDRSIERALEILPLALSGDMQGAMLKLHTAEIEAPVEKKAAPAAGQERKGEPSKESKDSDTKGGTIKSLLKSILPGSGSARKK